MQVYIIPIEIIALQGAALLVSIALETVVFYEKFPISRRQSLEYSIILNLFSGVASWILFLGLQRILPDFLRLELIGYVFFNKLYEIGNIIAIDSAIMLIGIGNFLWVCIVEFFGITLLENLLYVEHKSESDINKYNKDGSFSLQKSQYNTLFIGSLVRNDPEKAVTILTANTLSNGVIFLLLAILRLL